MYPFPDGGWVGGPRLPLHTEQYLLSHIDCLAEGVLSQEGKASQKRCFQMVVPSAFSTRPTLPAQPPGGFFVVSTPHAGVCL